MLANGGKEENLRSWVLVEFIGVSHNPKCFNAFPKS